MLPRWQKGRDKTLRALASPTSALHAATLPDALNTCFGTIFIPRRQPMPIWQKQLWALYLFRSSRNQSAWPLSPLASAVLAIAAHLLPEGLSKGADPISDLINQGGHWRLTTRNGAVVPFGRTFPLCEAGARRGGRFISPRLFFYLDRRVTFSIGSATLRASPRYNSPILEASDVYASYAF